MARKNGGKKNGRNAKNKSNTKVDLRIEKAAKSRDFSAIKEILSNFEITDLSHRSLTVCLQLALSQDCPETLLLFKDVLNNWTNKEDGRTILHLATEANAVECIDTLLEQKIVDNVSIPDDQGLCPAHVMVEKSNSLEGLALIISKMKDINFTNKEERTCLHTASVKNNLENVELLLQHGASINIQDKIGMSPLHMAAFGGCGAIAKALCESGAMVNIREEIGITPFEFAVLYKKPEVVKELLKYDFDYDIMEPRLGNGDYLIHIAAYNSDAQTVKMLLEKGAKINATNHDGQTPLFKTACEPKKDCVACTETLLNNGASIEIYDNNGKLPLYCAAESKNYYFIQTIKYYLDDHKKLLNGSLNSKNSNALFVAVEADDEKAIHALLAPPKSFKDTDEWQNRPLLDWTSSEHGDRSALSQAIVSDSLNAMVYLLKLGTDPCKEDKTGFTPLHYLMLKCKRSLVENMLAKILFVDLNIPDSKLGCTPYSIAAMSVRDGNRLPIVQHFVKPIDVSAPDFDGNTSLHFASMLGRVGMVQRLLSANANPNAKNKAGSTPLHSVFTRNSQELKKYISVFRATNCFEELAQYLEELDETMARASRKKLPGKTSMDRTNSKKRLAILKLLLGAGGNVSAKDSRKQTLLHLAASYDDDMEANWIMDQYPIDGKVMINTAYDWQGFLPLHVAAEAGNDGCTKLFLERGAKVTERTKDEDTETALSLACHSTKGPNSAGRSATVRLLLDAGAHPPEVDRKCQTKEDLMLKEFLKA